MTIAPWLLVLIAIPASPAGSGEPIMLDFTASWCGPCKQMRPAVEQLVKQGYPIKPVDIDRSPELAAKYEVKGVPAFIVVDPSSGRVLGRTEGYQPASNIASLYNQARAKLTASRPRAEPEDARDEPSTPDEGSDEQPAKSRGPAPNPRPWETVVRIKVHGAGAIGFGSGTIIASNDEESLILTCAHIFKLERGPQAPPSKFPRRITIDLFDGTLRGQQVHSIRGETYPGEAVDYDFTRDVGLIRIRPGRRLPYAKVVPPHWAPREKMGMITVGCSEGQDATAWNTVITNPKMRGLSGNNAYEAIECYHAPKQGRSGGGLFTSDGYVAGVCDFAEPRGNHGLYATPTSIYHILDRNELTALYTPGASPGSLRTQLAKNTVRPSPARSAPLVARGQSPARDDPGVVTLPPPEFIGIKTPVLAASESQSRDDAEPRGSNLRKTRNSWQARPTRTAELKMDPATDPDPFAAAPETASPEPEAAPSAEPPPTVTRASVRKWRAGRYPLPELATQER